MYQYDSIIVSGPPVSGKSMLEEGLLKQLKDWKFHSIGNLVRAGHEESKTKLPLSTWWSNLPEIEQVKLNEDLFDLVKNGKIIADTRYAVLCKDGNHLYKKTRKEIYKDVRLNSLLVFIEAPFDVRVERAQLYREDYKTQSKEWIIAELENREAQELRLGKEIFGINYQDKSVYDIVLDSAKMTVEQEVSAVMKKMKI
ncbi:MAG: hypothetical protein AABX93_00845 [Nanoarchaeota archaeon]